MRDYTYMNGVRFFVVNLFRSQRFDIDRLDINWVGEVIPEFIRGLRVVDHDDSETYLVNGEDADHLMFSLAYIHVNNDGEYRHKFDEYLINAIKSKDYLITRHVVKTETLDDVIH